ncbi:MAG TPA: SoxR reducing system RseC family protein [Bacteroidales bacterium]|nr:SoxR reducing system RseC family protein [Bacteroidales bacterium]
MSTGNAIEHSGVIENVSDDGIRVRFTSVSACAACHAKGVCSASDMEDKEVNVPNTGGDFHTGDAVTVMMKSSLGTKAVLIGYVYPFIILLVVLLILNGIGVPELRSGLISLGTLVPYYLIIYLIRHTIDRSFAFTIRKSL